MLAVIAKLFGDPRLLGAEHGKIDMHRDDRRRFRDDRQVDLVADEAVEIIDQVVTINHAQLVGRAG